MNEMQFMEIYSEIIKRHKTPVVSVDTTRGKVFAPRGFSDEDGSLQICISPKAVRDLKIENDIVYCRITLKQKPFSISFPLENVIEIFEDE